ncbi:Pre protein translocase subunit Sec66-domain-containing protein [Pseudomassariella vexata]|uniref:Pre protein translocase subunit Sec66-domain-containing protein n=1 Tax=Pseudomassariella vexata TaxID=1141098 RepID=A0A1Y2DLZ1_9PEZI|nr:Pre protein translocase subunit Sec66-domain-containing protein [Pseudomassariella vexata]ORY60174.1 Pre protein translocase subunit Sec66-domain-containing protein [Pseudomassariella vexata]
MEWFDIDWKGLALPFAYIFVLGGMLYTFSTIYRKRKASQSANLAPWFPPHLQKNIYSSLLEINAADNHDKKTRVPASVVRTALLRRAVEDIGRIIQVRSAKQALNTLLQRGSVGDDLMQRFSRAEKEMEEELRDVVMEANALAPGWGQAIFQSANEIAANTHLRARIDDIQAQAATEKEWWEKRRQCISKEFMKELDEEEELSKAGSVRVGSDDEGVLVDSTSPATSPGGSKKRVKK